LDATSVKHDFTADLSGIGELQYIVFK